MSEDRNARNDDRLDALAEHEPATLVGCSLDEPSVRAAVDALGLRPFDNGVPPDDDPEQCLSAPHLGLQVLHTSSGRIVTVFLFVAAGDGLRAYPGPLPRGLSASDGRADVRRRLGPASRSGKARADSLLGPQGAWDRYDGADVCLHVQYNFDGRGIRLVSLMAADRVP